MISHADRAEFRRSSRNKISKHHGSKASLCGPLNEDATPVKPQKGRRCKDFPIAPATRSPLQSLAVNADLDIHLNHFVYLQRMSQGAEEAFDHILNNKDDLLFNVINEGLHSPLRIALDGISTSIKREKISVLRPKTSAAHK